MTFSDEEERSEFLNFAFDGKAPVKKVKTEYGYINVPDREKLEEFKAKFNKMEKYYERDQQENLLEIDLGGKKKIIDFRETKTKPKDG